MSPRISEGDERLLAERLRREAFASRPEFSEALHARLCQAVEASRSVTPSPAARPLDPRSRATPWSMILALAACFLAMSLVGWQVYRWDQQAGLAGVNRPDLKSPGEPAPSLAQASSEPVNLHPVAGLAEGMSASLPALMDSALTGQRWAYLDHDAQLTMELFKQRFPSAVRLSLAASEPGPAP